MRGRFLAAGADTPDALLPQESSSPSFLFLLLVICVDFGRSAVRVLLFSDEMCLIGGIVIIPVAVTRVRDGIEIGGGATSDKFLGRLKVGALLFSGELCFICGVAVVPVAVTRDRDGIEAVGGETSERAGCDGLPRADTLAGPFGGRVIGRDELP